jgi:hypothetical protein
MLGGKLLFDVFYQFLLKIFKTACCDSASKIVTERLLMLVHIPTPFAGGRLPSGWLSKFVQLMRDSQSTLTLNDSCDHLNEIAALQLHLRN